MTETDAPDVLLLAEEWRPRALIRAQLIERGYEVIAVDAWPAARRHLRPGMKPRLVIVDLSALPDPQSTLRDLRVLMPPDRVLVLTALGTIAADDVRSFGFRVVSRPIAIDAIVQTAADAMRGPAVP